MSVNLTCVVCDKEFVGRDKNIKTCSNECRKIRRDKYYGIVSNKNSKYFIPSNKMGRLNELRIVNDLALLGFDVYSSDFPQQRYDMVIISRQSHKPYIVEVKTAYMRKNGKYTHPVHAHKKYDILALYIINIDKIVYLDLNNNEINIENYLD